MTVGERIDALRVQRKLSQSALARAAKVPQSTMNGLIKSDYRWSPHLVRIAAVLKTSVAYLAGETSDPAPDAPIVAPTPDVQFASLQVALPSEEALTRMFLGVLAASEGLPPDELARELAKTLPSGLSMLRGALTYGDPATDPDPLPEAAEAPPIADRVRRRA